MDADAAAQGLWMKHGPLDGSGRAADDSTAVHFEAKGTTSDPGLIETNPAWTEDGFEGVSAVGTMVPSMGVCDAITEEGLQKRASETTVRDAQNSFAPPLEREVEIPEMNQMRESVPREKARKSAVCQDEAATTSAIAANDPAGPSAIVKNTIPKKRGRKGFPAGEGDVESEKSQKRARKSLAAPDASMKTLISGGSMTAQMDGKPRTAKMSAKIRALKDAQEDTAMDHGDGSHPLEEKPKKRTRKSLASDGSGANPDAPASAAKTKRTRVKKANQALKDDTVALTEPEEERPMTRTRATGVSKASSSATRARRKEQPLERGEPHWSLPKLPPTSLIETKPTPKDPAQQEKVLRPVYWCTTKLELAATIPALAKPVHGIAWALCETPVVFLEQPIGASAGSIQASDLEMLRDMDAERKGFGVGFVLTMIRDFVCYEEDLVIQGALNAGQDVHIQDPQELRRQERQEPQFQPRPQLFVEPPTLRNDIAHRQPHQIYEPIYPGPPVRHFPQSFIEHQPQPLHHEAGPAVYPQYPRHEPLQQEQHLEVCPPLHPEDPSLYYERSHSNQEHPPDYHPFDYIRYNTRDAYPPPHPEPQQLSLDYHPLRMRGGARKLRANPSPATADLSLSASMFSEEHTFSDTFPKPSPNFKAPQEATPALTRIPGKTTGSHSTGGGPKPQQQRQSKAIPSTVRPSGAYASKPNVSNHGRPPTLNASTAPGVRSASASMSGNPPKPGPSRPQQPRPPQTSRSTSLASANTTNNPPSTHALIGARQTSNFPLPIETSKGKSGARAPRASKPSTQKRPREIMDQRRPKKAQPEPRPLPPKKPIVADVKPWSPAGLPKLPRINKIKKEEDTTVAAAALVVPVGSDLGSLQPAPRSKDMEGVEVQESWYSTTSSAREVPATSQRSSMNPTERKDVAAWDPPAAPSTLTSSVTTATHPHPPQCSQVTELPQPNNFKFPKREDFTAPAHGAADSVRPHSKDTEDGKAHQQYRSSASWAMPAVSSRPSMASIEWTQNASWDASAVLPTLASAATSATHFPPPNQSQGLPDPVLWQEDSHWYPAVPSPPLAPTDTMMNVDAESTRLQEASSSTMDVTADPDPVDTARPATAINELEFHQHIKLERDEGISGSGGLAGDWAVTITTVIDEPTIFDEPARQSSPDIPIWMTRQSMYQHRPLVPMDVTLRPSSCQGQDEQSSSATTFASFTAPAEPQPTAIPYSVAEEPASVSTAEQPTSIVNLGAEPPTEVSRAERPTGTFDSVVQKPAEVAEATPKRDLRVPCAPPSEVAAICDSYAAGTPLTIVATRAFLAQRWGIAVPDECGYAYLGFFKIVQAQETRLDLRSDEQKVVEEGVVAGRVQWRFECMWIPSGEDLRGTPSKDLESSRPWWAPNPSPPTTDEATTSTLSTTTATTTTTTITTTRLRQLRLQHPNYPIRQLPLHRRFEYLLPLGLHAPPPRAAGTDADLPTGWACRACGRVCFQSLMRHRQCPGLLCEARRRAKRKGKGKEIQPEVSARSSGKEGEKGREGAESVRGYGEDPAEETEEGYAVPLVQLRDPQQASPLSHPGNTYPIGLVDRTSALWGDGMQTFRYSWACASGNGMVLSGAKKAARGKGKAKAADVEVKMEVEEQGVGVGVVASVTHLFTGNYSGLQAVAGELLRDIQIHVPLRRPMAGPSE
ncbi:hypothetical protein H0H81_003112 [Sphagnurus paluster]|uniref:Uncharacterized protein n=1 Tax=Sphagnurus paluster TaxID=117069 RepID=A0A9P7GTM1_9AGAR|nr:hypothetical protein H0H81_003112 [Sphagnurus paluster]